MSGLLYVYYGDDFTGSTDVLESLALAGIRAYYSSAFHLRNTSKHSPTARPLESPVIVAAGHPGGCQQTFQKYSRD